MPSRKRNQGRARKANAAGSAPPASEPRPQPGEDWCRHDCSLSPDHVCNAFVKTCYEEWNKGTAGTSTRLWGVIAASMDIATKKYPINESDVDQAKSRFLEDGVNKILTGDDNPYNVGMIAAAVVQLERESVIITTKKMLRIDDILSGCKRTAIRFFYKRIPCSCLDNLYKRRRL